MYMAKRFTEEENKRWRAALRELREETGIEENIAELKLIGRIFRASLHSGKNIATYFSY